MEQYDLGQDDAGEEGKQPAEEKKEEYVEKI